MPELRMGTREEWQEARFRFARKAVLRLRTYSLVISMTGVIDPV
jgi:hypothetical protein